MKRYFLKTAVIELEKNEDPAIFVGKMYIVKEVEMLGRDHCIIKLCLLTQREPDKGKITLNFEGLE